VALDADTRLVLAMVAGHRSGATARLPWEAPPPPGYREAGTFATDLWAAYGAAIPADQHLPRGKGEGMTHHIERFLGTLRRRRARSVRETLSFSKQRENHIGALWFFIRLYNSSRR